MAGNTARTRLLTAFGALAVAIAAMGWFWLNGGARLPWAPREQAAIEECGATLSGSSAVGLELAPNLVTDFLRQGGYEVAQWRSDAAGVVSIVGRRGVYSCAVTIRTDESTTGFSDLASGEAQIALSSRPILPHDIEALQAGGASDMESARDQAEHVIAYDAMAMTVHVDNPLRQMSLDQVRLVGLGRVGNWSQIGGPDRVLNLYAPREIAGPDDFPNDVVQSGDLIWQTAERNVNATVLRDDPSVIDRIAEDVGGVGFISASFPRDASRVRDVLVSAGGAPAAPSAEAVRTQTYPIVRRIFLYVRPGDVSDNPFVRGFVAYAKSPQAFDRIEQSGFVALRPEAAVASVTRDIGCRLGTPESAALSSALQGAVQLEQVLRFRANTNELDDEALRDMDALAHDLIARIAAGDQILLVGHSDIAGRAEDNRQLAFERALAARAAFERAGVYGLHIESAGEMCPVADTETNEGRRSNRRVEIWVTERP